MVVPAAKTLKETKFKSRTDGLIVVIGWHECNIVYASIVIVDRRCRDRMVSWIYNYICNQYLPPLRLSVRIRAWRGVLDTTLCDQVCQWLTTGRWIYLGTPVSSTNKTDRRDIAELLLKVVFNTTTLILTINCD